jgi:putative ABC transport system permease protein
MRRRPGFTAVVAVTLSLGIGANSMMFGILDRLLLRAPAGIADPDRVVIVNTHRPGASSYQTTQSYGLSTALARVSDFEDVAVATATSVTRRVYFPLGRGASAGRVVGSLVSASYFPLLGVHPALGRFFAASEERDNDAQKLAVIGYGFWQRQFGGRTSAIGQTLEIGSARYTIVGVTPEGFSGTELSDVDVWLPITAADGLRFDKSREWTTTDNSQWVSVFARLKRGARLERAAAQASAAMRSWRSAQHADLSPSLRGDIDSTVVVLGSIVPGKSLSSFGVGAKSSEVRVSKLLAAVALMVLLITIANVANLLLVRALSRRREIAVRLALGVGRRRLVVQLLTEGVLLAVLGGVGALVLTEAASRVVRVWLLGDGAWTGRAIDVRVLVFTMVVALAAGILTSLVPALQTSRPDLTQALKAGAREGSVQRSRTRSVLLVAQAALAIVLLTGAGLFVSSLRNVAALDLGLDVDHVLVAQISQGSVGLSNAESRRLFAEFEARAAALPGVRSAAVSVGLPFNLSWGQSVTAPGRTLPKLQTNPLQYIVTPGYFDALGIRLIAGRVFTNADRVGAAPVMVINETMARVYFPATNPVGACLKVGADSMPCTTIVGVVTNTRRQSLVEGLVPQFYRPLDQLAAAVTDGTVSFFGYTMVVRTRGDAASLVEPLRRQMQGVGSQVPYATVVPMRALVQRQTRAWELGARVFTAFGSLALALAAIGLFSVVAFTIGQRMHEFGVRSALGAQSADLLRLTVVRGLAPAAIGIVTGVFLALAGGRFVGGLLFQTSPNDPIVLGGASAVLFAAAIVASVIPAVRATKVDPTIALRSD